MLQIRVPTGDVWLDMVPHDVLMHPHLRVTQYLISPHEKVIHECRCGESEVGSVVLRVHTCQPETDWVSKQCPMMAHEPLLSAYYADCVKNGYFNPSYRRCFHGRFQCTLSLFHFVFKLCVYKFTSFNLKWILFGSCPIKMFLFVLIFLSD